MRGLMLYFPTLEPWLRGLPRSPPFVRFICERMWGHGVLPAALPAPFSATLSPALLVYLCANVGPHVLPWSDCLPRSSHGGNESPFCPGCPSPPLLPVWMSIYFLFPWCRTSLPFDFLSVLVVRGGTVCLPMLPSWFSLATPHFHADKPGRTTREQYTP